MNMVNVYIRIWKHPIRTTICAAILPLALACGCGGRSEFSRPVSVDFPSKSASKNQQVPHSHSGVADPGKVNRTELVHKVVVQVILPTEKYVYLRVEEEGMEYWIATTKMEVEPGGTYFYGNRLLKTNFWSNEYGRSFDRLYLVSQLVPESHGVRQSEPIVAEDDKPDTWPESSTVTNFPRTEPKTGNDLICIVDLVQNKSSYDGKHVRIHARCTKVNSNIMGRNWVHLQDGTYDAFDLVVTTLSHVKAGSELEIEAKVVLDKDFGSGYYYDLILEDGAVLTAE
jgi:hypothetical protein